MMEPRTPLNTKRFQVALSFSGEHRKFVEGVAEQLSRRLGKNRVFYDRYYEAELARPNLDTYLINIYRDEADLIAIFLCANYAHKDWCGLEWRVVRDILKRRHDSEIMPLKFDDVMIEGLLSIDGHIEIGSKTPEAVAELILQRIRGVRHTSASGHFAHGESLPYVWANRDQDLKRFAQYLDSPTIHVIGVVGISGTGKSSLVLKLLQDSLPDKLCSYRHLWFSFQREADLDRFFFEAATYFLPDFNPRRFSTLYAKASQLRTFLSTNPCLIVMDGLETMLRPDSFAFKDQVLLDFLLGMCGNQATSQVIITSQYSLTELNDKSGYFHFDLHGLSPEAAVSYMRQRGVHGSDSGIKSLCKTYGYHPMTLSVIADYLRFPPNSGHIKAGALPSPPTNMPPAQKLYTVLEAYWNRLSPIEKFFMIRLSVFRMPVPDSAFRIMAINESGERCSPDHRGFREALYKLRYSSLLQIDNTKQQSFYSAHPLIKSYFNEKLPKDEQIRLHVELKNYVETLPIPETPYTIDDIDPLIEAFHHSISAHLYEDAFEIYHTRQLGKLLFWWGNYILARGMLEQLHLASEEQKWFPSALQLHEMWKWIGNILSKSGNPIQALEYHRLSAEVDANDPFLQSQGWLHLSETHAEMGCFYEAKSSLVKAEKIERQLDMPERQHLILGFNGYYNVAFGYYQVALSHLLEAITLCTDNPGHRCLWLRKLGDLYVIIGNLSLAYQRYREGLELAQSKEYGFRDYEGHILRGIGDYYRYLRIYEQAIINYDRAIIIAQDLGYIWLEAESRVSKSWLKLTVGRSEDASKEAMEVLNLVGKNNWIVEELSCCLILGRISKDNGDIEKFMSWIDRADSLNSICGVKHLSDLLQSIKDSKLTL